MPMKRCMNAGCDVVGAEGGGWRNGWLLRSGGYATLCDQCGLAYEQLVFCDKFHQKESGWRECSFCGKRLHCGCIASKSILDLLDGGGVQCLSCLKSNGNSSIPGESLPDIFPQSSQRSVTLSARCSANEKMNDLGISLADGSYGLATSSFDHTLTDDGTAKCNVMKLGRNTEVHGCDTFFLSQRENTNGFFSHVRPEQVALHLRELGRQGYSGRDQGCIKLSRNVCQSNSKDALKDDSSNAIAEGHLSKSLSSSNLNAFEACSYAGIQKFSLSHRGAVVDAKDQNKALAAFQHVQRPRQVLPKLPKANHGAVFDVAKELAPQMRVARPPAEGRGRNQLLPRYWPRITDQELQQISGDSNSTIVPLFEKVLSASDAGRIGRLVLPKACAEAYFPPISQPEGLPLKIQDAKGKEWHFQFRFWPNNNSRMYVLEGVTPCIQSLQLQAGDTVTFSRMDPEGKLVMGFRKATNTAPLQESQISTMANGALGNEAIYPGVNNLSIVNGYSGLIQTLKGTGTSHLSHFSENLNCTDGDISCMKTDMHGSWVHEGLLQPLLVLDQRSRSIGSKSKRLLMDNDDAMELQLTWEEAQDLLCPPPRVKPSVVIIEDQEFEEYEEPPVLGKRTFFTAQPSGGLDQWIQCDDCLKWRRIPVEVLPPSKWACVDNNWDPKRSSCAVTDELTPSELQALLLQHAEIKRRRITSSKASSSEAEPTGVGALGSAAVLGQMGNQNPSTVATTTRHPRHRPGCTCIVCIQPPSGKGPKHSPNCTCNVCMTVKRRFKTLMMRKKKRQFEREEADTDKRSEWVSKEELDGSGSSLPREELVESLDASKGHIDLNRQPQRDAGQQQAAGTSCSPQLSMTSLIQIAGHPLENYLKQNKLASLTTSEHQVSSSSATVPQVLMESDSGGDDEHCGSEKIVSPAAVA